MKNSSEEKVIVVLTTGYMDWKVYGVYASHELMEEKLREDFKLGPEDSIEDVLEDGEIRIVENCEYFNK